MNRRCRGDAGQVAGIEVLPFGFLIFVSLTLLIVNIWAVIDARMAVSSASREAVRAYVEAPNESVAEQAAHQRAQETLRAFGRDTNRSRISIDSPAGGFARCGRVRIHVGYELPAIAVPFLNGFGDGIDVTSTSSEVIDPFRNNVPGSVVC